jgi:ABC-type antimicrobial peptide transport system permease subunit
MFGVFAALALVVAATGLYAVIAYVVAQRTHEFGVRVAVGASRGNIIRLVVRQSITIVVSGTAIAAGIVLWAGRWIEPQLFEESPRDPTVFGIVLVTIICVSLAASLLPAMRAASVDPMTALRAD